MRLIVILATHPEYLLNSQDAFHEDGSQLVSNPRQQKAKERDAKYGIKNAKDFPAHCSRSYVSITCQITRTQGRGEKGEKRVKKHDMKDKKTPKKCKGRPRRRGRGGGGLKVR